MTEQDLAAFDRESERRQRAEDFRASHPEYERARCSGCSITVDTRLERRDDDTLLCMACALGDSN